MSRVTVSSNLHQLPLLLKELGDAGFQVQVDQIHGMGEFIHQPAEQAVEAFGRTATDANIQV
jgi:hypothetical protein